MKQFDSWLHPITLAIATVAAVSLTAVPAGAADKRIVIKGGQIGGAFNRWTSAWSVYLSTTIAGTQFSSESSTGSPENLRAVGSGNGGVLPFGVLSSGSDGLVCLKTGPQFPSECDPNVSGNFNFLDFRKFGNLALGPPPSARGDRSPRSRRTSPCRLCSYW